MKLGTRDYLIQQNWLNANGGGCALAWTVTPDFSVSISPTSQTLPYTGGTTAPYTITNTALNGFTGTVGYGSVTGLPSGATATPVASDGTFTVTSLSSTPTGTYTLSVVATSGALSHTATTMLVVRRPARAKLQSQPLDEFADHYAAGKHHVHGDRFSGERIRRECRSNGRISERHFSPSARSARAAISASGSMKSGSKYAGVPCCPSGESRRTHTTPNHLSPLQPA